MPGDDHELGVALLDVVLDEGVVDGGDELGHEGVDGLPVVVVPVSLVAEELRHALPVGVEDVALALEEADDQDHHLVVEDARVEDLLGVDVPLHHQDLLDRVLDLQRRQVVVEDRRLHQRQQPQLDRVQLSQVHVPHVHPHLLPQLLLQLPDALRKTLHLSVQLLDVPEPIQQVVPQQHLHLHDPYHLRPHPIPELFRVLQLVDLQPLLLEVL